MESPDNTVALETPNDTLTTDKLEEEFEFDEKEFSNLTDSNGNLNISEISRTIFVAFITHKEVRSKKIIYIYLHISIYYTHKEYHKDIYTRSKET